MLALLFMTAFTPVIGAENVPLAAVAITATFTVAQYFLPAMFRGTLHMGLQKGVWVPGIKENPVPDHSFIIESEDMSEYVENNKLHLAEAGIDPQVHENYFQGKETPLPVSDIRDIPNEVVLNTYSTEQTRHRDLQEVELQYDRRASLIQRHKNSLAKNLGKRAAFQWAPEKDNESNKIFNIKETDSVIDALIDLEAFYAANDIFEGLNICFTPEHMARIKKEDKKLYKEILDEGRMYGFKVHRYSQNPLYNKASGAKKPFGSVITPGEDVRATFTWVKGEVFRCWGDTEMYATLRDAGLQADLISFAQRALVGKIRANSPKYHGAII